MNFASFLILTVIIAIVGLIIYKMVQDKRAGKTSCGGDCAHCGHCSGLDAMKRSS